MKKPQLTFDLEEAYLILEQTPHTVKNLLERLPEHWVRTNEGGESWSAFDIVGHYIHGERTDWIPRTKLILSDSNDKTFEPFDRFAQFENSVGKSLEDLLKEFIKLRKQNLDYLKSLQLTTADLNKTGRHPEFGAVSLQELLSAWVVHDLSHINQISRVLAKLYQQNVGKWSAYMSLLTD